jgi:hypothetical protein
VNALKRRSELVLLGLLLTSAGSASGRVPVPDCRTIAVSQGAVPYAHVRSIQTAVDRARPCDWVLIARGVYHGAITIRTADLHLRGLDRNHVIVEGGHEVGNGITVEANGVSIENLTVRNFDRRSVNDDSTGNQVLWRSVRNWFGRYLTTYDTGLLGGYGLWASRSRYGVLDHVYASGFSDSGFYVGACGDCRAVIEHSLAERNLIGFAATNASGHLVVESSTFRFNAVGASFNSSESDPPPPQLGTCAAGANRSPTPMLTTTRLARCTVFRNNDVVDNNALGVPSDTAAVRPGSGIGLDLLGAYGDLIDRNVISGNLNVGVLGLQLPIEGAARFALTGTRISDNRISGSRLEIGLAGTRSSVDNCVQQDSEAPTLPSDLLPFSCSNNTTPPLPESSSRQVTTLVSALHAQFAAHARHPQPSPPNQPTMPTPCRGAPPTPLCQA